MSKFLSAGLARVREFVWYKYGRTPLVRAAKAAVLGVISLALGTILVNEAPAIWASIKAFLDLPVRFGGLVIIGTLLALIVLAFLDTSPTVAAVKEWRARRKQTPQAEAQQVPPPLSGDERHAVEDARVFWNTIGNKATGQIAWGLLEQAIDEVAKTTRLAGLLRPEIEKLRDARQNLEKAVRDHAQVPLAGVCSHLLVLFTTYMNAVSWLHELADTHGIRLDTEPYAERYRRWEQLHEQFKRDLTTLSLRAAYAPIRYEVAREDMWTIRFTRAGA